MLIQFAAGDIEPDLVDRAGGESSPSATARRDLERYYRLLRDEIARVRLSQVEAIAVAVALRTWVIEDSSYRHVWIELESHFKTQVESRGVAEFDTIARLAASDRAMLVKNMRTLSPGEAMALGDAVERFWLLVKTARARADGFLPADSVKALLRVAGLVDES